MITQPRAQLFACVSSKAYIKGPCAGCRRGRGREPRQQARGPRKVSCCYLVSLLFLCDIVRMSSVLLFCADGKKSAAASIAEEKSSTIDYYWTRKNTVQSCNQIVNVAVTIKAKMLLTQRGHLHKYVSKVRAKTRIDECA